MADVIVAPVPSGPGPPGGAGRSASAASVASAAPVARAAPVTLAALAALLLAFGAVLAFRVGTPPLASSAEARCDDVVANMVRSGDWLVPVFHGQVRLQKPPLFYWEASALGVAAGGAGRTTLRLPSVAAALLLVVLVFRWGRRLGGDRLGLLAAAALVMMESMIALGRTGTAEMTLSLCCNLALFTFHELDTTRRRGLLPLFALWCALAILAKATVALLVIGLPIAVHLVAEGRWRSALSRRVLLWVTLAVVAGFAWYVVVIILVPDGWRRIYAELVLPLGVRTADAEGSAGHREPFWSYLPVVVGATFPAVLALPLVVGRAVRGRFWRGDRGVRFAAVVFVSLFVAFSIIPAKQKHYLLPLLPSLALLVADTLLAAERLDPAALRRRLLAVALPGVAFGVVMLGVLWIVYAGILGVAPGLVGAALLVGGLLAVLLLRAAWSGRVPRFVALAAAGALLASFVWYGSLDIWRRQFEDGSASRRPDYVAARWDDGARRWPAIVRLIRPEEHAR